jgi:hypothetical protein
MPNYRLRGLIMLESTRQEAAYDFEDEFDYPPTEMDVLNRMMNTGEIQIIHEITDEVEEEDADI